MVFEDKDYHDTIRAITNQLQSKDKHAAANSALSAEISNIHGDHIRLQEATRSALNDCEALDSESRALVALIQKLWHRLVAGRHKHQMPDESHEQTIAIQSDAPLSEEDFFSAGEDPVAQDSVSEICEVRKASTNDVLNPVENIKEPPKSENSDAEQGSSTPQETEHDVNPQDFLVRENEALRLEIKERDFEVTELEREISKLQLKKEKMTTRESNLLMNQKTVRSQCLARLQDLSQKLKSESDKVDALRSKKDNCDQELSKLDAVKKENASICQTVMELQLQRQNLEKQLEELRESMRMKSSANESLKDMSRKLELEVKKGTKTNSTMTYQQQSQGGQTRGSPRRCNRTPSWIRGNNIWNE